jgi:hypothetical protein
VQIRDVWDIICNGFGSQKVSDEMSRSRYTRIGQAVANRAAAAWPVEQGEKSQQLKTSKSFEHVQRVEQERRVQTC